MQADGRTKHLNVTSKHFASPAALRVDQFQIPIFKDTDKAVLPVRGEVLIRFIHAFFSTLIVGQRGVVLAREDQCFAIIEWADGGIVSLTLALPGAF